MTEIKYAARVSVGREVLTEKNIMRFFAKVIFPDGAEIVKYLDAPNDREYNPNDDAMLLRVYPVLSILLNDDDYAFFDGKVSEGLLAGLYTAGNYYHSVFNEENCLYHKINIIPREEVHVEPKPFAKDSVIAFSGGVDASHLLLTHVRGLCGPRNTNIKTAIVFQNLEILSQDDEKYQRKFNICKETLAHFGIETVKIDMPGEAQGFMQYKFNICSGLFLFANTQNYAYGMLGSDGKDFRNIHFTCDESTPLITDNIASKAFWTREEGFEYTRTQKCKLLSTEPIIMKNLMTCFFTDYSDIINCGHCVKCSRTILNFWANGVHELPFIKGDISTKVILKNTKKILKKCQFGTWHFYKDIVDNTIDSEKKSYWYKKLKKYVYKRHWNTILSFLFEPIIVSFYRTLSHLAFSSKTAKKFKYKAKLYSINIRENNVLLERSIKYEQQINFSKYMHWIKYESLKNKQ